MGLHDQRKQSTDCDSVLRKFGFTTNRVGNKTDRIRLHNSPQWAADNHTPKWVWSKATSKGRNILPTCEQHRNITQVQALGDTSTRQLDIQQSRVLGETPQSQTQSNAHARPTASSPNGQAWRLQENNSTRARWHNRRLWGEATPPWTQSTKEDA